MSYFWQWSSRLTYANKNDKSYSNFWYAYKLPSGLEYAKVEANNFIAKSCNFRVEEFEVLKIKFWFNYYLKSYKS